MSLFSTRYSSHIHGCSYLEVRRNFKHFHPFTSNEVQGSSPNAVKPSKSNDYCIPTSKVNEHDDIGWECLRRTNDYRASKGLSPLTWNQDICNISLPHSKHLCSRPAPRSADEAHAGADERMAKFPTGYRGTAENVAGRTNPNRKVVAQTAVDGWIKSPGHEKNLRSDSTDCAIAVFYTPQHGWWITQMFAKFEKRKPIKYERY